MTELRSRTMEPSPLKSFADGDQRKPVLAVLISANMGIHHSKRAETLTGWVLYGCSGRILGFINEDSTMNESALRDVYGVRSTQRLAVTPDEFRRIATGFSRMIL